MSRLIKQLNTPKETGPVPKGESILNQSCVASPSLAMLANSVRVQLHARICCVCECEYDWDTTHEISVKHRVFLWSSYVTKLPLTANAASQRNYLGGHTMQRFSKHLLTAMSSFNVEKPPHFGRCADGCRMHQSRRLAGSGTTWEFRA